MNKPCLTDEMIIDMVLNQQTLDQVEQAKAHIDLCPHCQRRYEEWQRLLGDSTNEQMPWRYTSHKLKKRLKEKIFPSQDKKTVISRPAIMLLSVSLILCLTLLAGVWPFADPFTEKSPESPTRQTSTDLTHDSQFLMNPQTIHYRIQHTVSLPVEGHQLPLRIVNGNLWIDHRGQELFLVLEGLEPLPENDYQVWVITQKMANNAGLFNHNDSSAFLYWRNEQPAEIEMIRVSIEPKGGSFYPSGPEALLIPLRQ
jgi:hypothetical protein